MAQENTFAELLRRVREGDQDAAAQLVRQYEPDLRVAIHVRLTDPTMRRLVDSMDICQSILGSFFLRVAAGQYELETPKDLFKLLTVMAQNKIIDYANKLKAAKRDQRRNVSEGVEELDLAADQTSPSSVVANRELLQEIQRRLTHEERQIADYRQSGLSWKEIAEKMGGQPNALRMRHDRAIDRVMKELNLDA